MLKILKKPTQEQRILTAFKQRKDKWISGTYFLHSMYISQYHTRISNLRKKGHKIEVSEDWDKFGFRLYRLNLKK